MSDTLLLPPGEPPSRLSAVRAWLTRTFTGRAILAGLLIKLIAFAITRVAGHSKGVDAFDSIGDIALVIAAGVLGYRVYVDAKRRLLWRVRRKLVLSYIFIGVMIAPVAGSGSCPAWMQIVLNRASLRSFTVSVKSVL